MEAQKSIRLEGVTLRLVGKVWHYRFRVRGQRTERSSGERSLAAATTKALKALEAARAKAEGVEPCPSVSGLVLQWLEAHEGIVSDRHWRAVERFGRLHLHGLGEVLVSDLTTAMVERARKLFMAAGHRDTCANQWRAILRLLMGWAISRGMIRFVPWHLKRLKVQRKPKFVMPYHQALAWLEAVEARSAHEPNIRLVVMLMMGLGLREDEALGARWEWLDLDRRRYTPGRTKGREAEPRECPDWLLEQLAPRRQPSGLMAPASNGRRLTPGKVRRVMDAASDACGIVGLTPHRLRGTYATWLQDEGVPLTEIQQALGHKDPRTTWGYLERSRGHIRQAQERLATKTGLAGRKTGEGKGANPQ